MTVSFMKGNRKKTVKGTDTVTCIGFDIPLLQVSHKNTTIKQQESLADTKVSAR